MTFNQKQSNYQEWLNHPNLDAHLKKELLRASESDLQSAFGATELEFGTAGIRGIMGPGPCRFNVYTIKKVTIAFAKYLQAHYPNSLNKGVVIGHDSRHHSQEFAQLAADILTSFSIPVYLFADNEMIPTPVVSFSTRKLKAIGGIVITASHNPAIYNGYKIYDSLGTQLDDSATNEIAKNMEEIYDILGWKFEPQPQLINKVPNLILTSYNNMLKKLQFYPQKIKNKYQLKIVYSGVNGTGNLFTPKVLRQFGYDVIDVPEHNYVDSDFKNVGNPNPEFAPAWHYPLIYAKNTHADLIIMNDPDADRIGIAVNDGRNNFVRLNGNETGPLLIDWKLSQQKLHNKLPKNPVLYSSIVTSNLGDRIAKETYKTKIIKTLTGFKWMGAEINLEKQRNLKFVFAYEESFGYVLDSSTRDKDGIQAAVMVSEMAWFHKFYHHETLLNYLNKIYKKYGYYYTATSNYEVNLENKEKIFTTLMNQLRNDQLTKIGQLKIEKKEDYINGLGNMPAQNLIKIYFANGSWIAIRPSGTEPKLKIYFVIVGRNKLKAKLKYRHLLSALNRKLKIKL